MDNGYKIIDTYRRARGYTWPELYKEMGLRDIGMNTIYLLVMIPTRKARPMYARKIDGWLKRNAEKIRAAIEHDIPAPAGE